jgi:hypothetical protein
MSSYYLRSSKKNVVTMNIVEYDSEYDYDYDYDTDYDSDYVVSDNEYDLYNYKTDYDLSYYKPNDVDNYDDDDDLDIESDDNDDPNDSDYVVSDDESGVVVDCDDIDNDDTNDSDYVVSDDESIVDDDDETDDDIKDSDYVVSDDETSDDDVDVYDETSVDDDDSSDDDDYVDNSINLNLIKYEKQKMDYLLNQQRICSNNNDKNFYTIKILEFLINNHNMLKCSTPFYNVVTRKMKEFSHVVSVKLTNNLYKTNKKYYQILEKINKLSVRLSIILLKIKNKKYKKM